MSKRIIQNMTYRQSLMKYAEKYGVSRTCQQEPVVHLLLEVPLGQNGDALSLPTTYSSADFLKRLVKWYVHRGIRVECFQTDSGFEFTNRFSKSRRDLSTLFETSVAQLGICHKLVRSYTPRHNAEESNRQHKALRCWIKE